MTSIGAFHCFARSGGTLVNRLLGATPGVVVLSEVNPRGSVRDPVEQAIEWLRLATPEEADELGRLPFGELIAELARRAAARNASLVVRDFPTPNFLPGAHGTAPATGQLELAAALGAVTARAVVARRAAAVYTSIVESIPHLAALPLDEFAVAYLDYALAVAGVPFIRYEELVADPGPTLQRLCELLGCPFDPVALDTFSNFGDCTGDVNPVMKSRGASLGAITALPERDDDPRYRAASAHPLCRAADDVFGYEALGRSGSQAIAFDSYRAVLASTRRALVDLASSVEPTQRRVTEEADRARDLLHQLERVAADASAAAQWAKELEVRLDAANAEKRSLRHQLQDAVAKAEALAADAAAARQDGERARAEWDRTSGELSRMEAIAADQRRQLELLITESTKEGDR